MNGFKIDEANLKEKLWVKLCFALYFLWNEMRKHLFMFEKFLSTVRKDGWMELYWYYHQQQQKTTTYTKQKKKNEKEKIIFFISLEQLYSFFIALILPCFINVQTGGKKNFLPITNRPKILPIINILHCSTGRFFSFLKL